MPEDRNYRTRLYESYASGFAGDAGEGRAGPTLKSDVLRHLPREREARILDAGCGQGELLALLEAAGYARLAGVDVSPEQVALARKRGLRTAVEQGDLLEHLTANPRSYDVILAVDVIEHFDKHDIPALLDAIASALAPGGMLVARVPNAESPYGGRLRYGDFTHGVAFTHHSLRQVLVAAGFSSIEAFATRPAVHSPLSLARLALWSVVAATRRLALAIETGLPRGHIVSQNLVAVARLGAAAPAGGADPPAR